MHKQVEPSESIWLKIADSADVVDGGIGVRFEIIETNEIKPAFVIRYDGVAYGYLNQCAHVAMELDWQAGHFFDLDKQYLMCATHAAMYEPQTGACVAGPCVGKRLLAIEVKEENGCIYARQ